jgi:uncharacterized Ntn-hydrolase superfamily protein
VTYSLVARDPDTGELGVAVQSHWFCVGPVGCWAEAGVGVVATQAFAEPEYGRRGLERMRSGQPAAAALHSLLAEDPDEAIRQVAMVDVHGRVAVHTGARCVAEAGHRVAEGVSVQANMMRRATVPEAMLAAFRAGSGPLAERLFAALAAAEAEGGDVRGRQSAALVVVAGRAGGGPLADRPVDLRVDDHPDPLGELRRMLALRRAYDGQERGEDLLEAGDAEAALREFDVAQRLAPDNAETAFWRGLALAKAGRIDDARPLIARACAEHDGWAELLRRLPAAGLAPDDAPDRLLPPGA